MTVCYTCARCVISWCCVEHVLQLHSIVLISWLHARFVITNYIISPNFILLTFFVTPATNTGNVADVPRVFSESGQDRADRGKSANLPFFPLTSRRYFKVCLSCFVVACSQIPLERSCRGLVLSFFKPSRHVAIVWNRETFLRHPRFVVRVRDFPVSLRQAENLLSTSPRGCHGESRRNGIWALSSN